MVSVARAGGGGGGGENARELTQNELQKAQEALQHVRSAYHGGEKGGIQDFTKYWKLLQSVKIFVTLNPLGSLTTTEPAALLKVSSPICLSLSLCISLSFSLCGGPRGPVLVLLVCVSSVLSKFSLPSYCPACSASFAAVVGTKVSVFALLKQSALPLSSRSRGLFVSLEQHPSHG